MEDGMIVELYWQRSEDAIAQTQTKYGAYCGAIAWGILHSWEEAEECVSDTWMNAWNAMPTARPSRLAAFLGRITRNLALDRWDRLHAQKRGGGQGHVLLDELAECVPALGGVSQQFDERETARLISDFLRTCKPEERGVFLRRYWYADPVSDVARRFAVSEAKVKSMLFRLRKRLKAYLEEQGVCV